MRRTTATKKKAKRTVTRNRPRHPFDLSTPKLLLSYKESEELHWSRVLGYLGACDEAIEFAKKFKTMRDAVRACEEEAWVKWLIYRNFTKHKRDRLVFNRDGRFVSLSSMKRKYKATEKDFKRLLDRARAQRFGKFRSDDKIVVGDQITARYDLSNGYYACMSPDLAKDIVFAYGKV